jgi:hypothetical protein
MSPKSSAENPKPSAETAIVRIRQCDTGGIRELPEAQWRKDEKTLRAEGFIPVDANDQPLAEAGGAGDAEKE